MTVDLTRPSRLARPGVPAQACPDRPLERRPVDRGYCGRKKRLSMESTLVFTRAGASKPTHGPRIFGPRISGKSTDSERCIDHSARRMETGKGYPTASWQKARASMSAGRSAGTRITFFRAHDFIGQMEQALRNIGEDRRGCRRNATRYCATDLVCHRTRGLRGKQREVGRRTVESWGSTFRPDDGRGQRA